jgi:hypothetical protein
MVDCPASTWSDMERRVLLIDLWPIDDDNDDDDGYDVMMMMIDVENQL